MAQVLIKLDENVARWLEEQFRAYSWRDPDLNGRKVFEAVKEALRVIVLD